MILHARFEGVHAALIHSPCLTRSLMLDERLAQSSHCIIIIIITFSIALYRCLFFHKFSSLSRSDHVENNIFHEWCMKLSFHQVFIHPQRTPIEWVMPVLLWRCNLSKAEFRLHIVQCFCHISLYRSSNSSILDALELALDVDSDFQLFFLEHVWPGPQNWWKQRRPFLRFGDGDARVCNSFRYDFSPLNLYLMTYMVSETWDFSHNLLFLRSLAWPSTKQVQDLQIISQTNASITTIFDKVSCD
jgi:hypothetical protein